MSTLRTCSVLILISAPTAIAAGPYQPTTESLRSHKAPQWSEDGKFGIFIHWGPYAVPAYHEWYVEFISPKANFGFMMGGPPYTATRGDLPDEIFREKTRADAVEYHRKNWGADFPYDDFIPMFKAEKFDPATWARLFRDSGAQYVVLTAKHGDEFAMWPSKYTHRRITGQQAGPLVLLHYWEPNRDVDVRFTRKGNTLYARSNGPQEELRLTSLTGKQVTKVDLLGLDEPVKWKQDDTALVIQPPAKPSGKYAFTFRIACKNL